ncbi:four helix bundle protein [Dyadobacter sp. CY326]|uniref:four helix bundle protein n=1 Tax=Dyadobacter sp. CY326 TaxID=2907300 RepID=UPI001F32337E|nr:four helix bundle protein [Dyadobacter sp. CY326]MCE7068381.1 four helix bundle protein [Dyadobacter sp. CY326]
MRLEDLQIYQMAMKLGEDVWQIISEWSYWDKEAFGKQLIRAADSIAANLAEGFGRYHLKDSLNFCYYSRGSLKETISWLTKACNRNLLSKEKFEELTQLCNTLSIKLNNYIKTLRVPNFTVNK